MRHCETQRDEQAFGDGIHISDVDIGGMRHGKKKAETKRMDGPAFVQHTYGIVPSHMRHAAILHHRASSVDIARHGHTGGDVWIRWRCAIGAVLLLGVVHHVLLLLLLRKLLMKLLRMCRGWRAVIGVVGGRRRRGPLAKAITLGVHDGHK